MLTDHSLSSLASSISISSKLPRTNSWIDADQFESAAQIALGHHEALIIERLQKGVTVFDESRLKSIGQELSNATKKTTGLVRHIVQKGLTQHLPISVYVLLGHLSAVGTNYGRL